MSIRHSVLSAQNFLSTCEHSALSALFPDGHSALSASDSTCISMQACASCVVLIDMDNLKLFKLRHHPDKADIQPHPKGMLYVRDQEDLRALIYVCVFVCVCVCVFLQK